MTETRRKGKKVAREKRAGKKERRKNNAVE